MPLEIQTLPIASHLTLSPSYATVRSITEFEPTQQLAPHKPFKFEIWLKFSEQQPANTNWHSRIVHLNYPFPLPFAYAVPSENRFLTSEEQMIFQRALRRSVRVIATARPINKEV